jgi:hypothetical protein
MSCGSTPETSVYPVRVLAMDADGDPVEGLTLAGDGTPLGATDAGGAMQVQLSGVEGGRVGLRPTCPAGYRGPSSDTTFWLRKVVGLDGKPGQAQITMTCEALEHRLVVVIKTNAPPLALRILNAEVGRTSEHGTAHVLRSGPPGTSFTLALDTEDDPELRPRSPARLFVIPKADGYVVWEQPFQRLTPPKAKAVRIRKAPPPKKIIPERLGRKG